MRRIAIPGLMCSLVASVTLAEPPQRAFDAHVQLDLQRGIHKTECLEQARSSVDDLAHFIVQNSGEKANRAQSLFADFDQVLDQDFVLNRKAIAVLIHCEAVLQSIRNDRSSKNVLLVPKCEKSELRIVQELREHIHACTQKRDQIVKFLEAETTDGGEATTPRAPSAPDRSVPPELPPPENPTPVTLEEDKVEGTVLDIINGDRVYLDLQRPDGTVVDLIVGTRTPSEKLVGATVRGRYAKQWIWVPEAGKYMTWLVLKQIAVTTESNQAGIDAGQTSIGEVRGGGLLRHVIADIVKSHHDEIKLCYETGLNKNGALTGKVSIVFKINASGEVFQAVVSETSLRSTVTESCMLSRIRTWRFPRPRGGGLLTVTFPFIFRSAAASDVKAGPRGGEFAGPR